ncbi:MAG: alpha-E domain-containing protein [Alphaproteobacteria bacterium]|nr:alpha-E domain-containing protein [Alphaproteobacteria bacterium]MDE2340158.1 alpha-E domain-containing protein [Alphaproteobacteria bacterium]
MLSRTAASLYWLGRYAERADFSARLIEATVRLDALSTRPAGSAAWASALNVIDAGEAFAALGKHVEQRHVAPFLLCSPDHPGSIWRCLEAARTNARAVRMALSRESWSAINNAWLRVSTGGVPKDGAGLLALLEGVHSSALSLTGAIERMLKHPSSMFMRLGGAIERVDNTARLLDVKYHILLPEEEVVGGVLDRDQWTTILQTVSAVNAYRFLYSGGLNARNVIEFLVLRPELPRSLIAGAQEALEQLQHIAEVTHNFSAADSLAMTRLAVLRRLKVDAIIGEGLHEYLEDFIEQNAALDQAISTQFRFF